MRARLLRVGLVAIGIAIGALSVMGKQAYTVYGVGTVSCGKWVAEKEQGTSASHKLSWVLGYVTGVGSFSDDKFSLKKTDSAGITLWIDQYCAQHPLEDIVDAANKLVITLAKK